MNKKIIVILLSLLSLIMISSCERDDICIDEITPQLIIRFYNNDTPELFKRVNQLSVKIAGIENDSLMFNATDSIAIPLKVTEDMTQYTLTINSDNGAELIRDIITVNYEREDVFVARSCGFKTIFNNTNYTQNSNNWVQTIETITQTIDNETNAHLKIFH